MLVLDDVRHSYVDLDDPTHLEFAYTQLDRRRDRRDAHRRARRSTSSSSAAAASRCRAGWPRRARARARACSRSTATSSSSRASGSACAARPPCASRSATRASTLRDEPTASADVVVGDAFGTYAVPWHLATREWAAEVRRVLRPGGLYALNVIDYPPLDLLRAEAATLLDALRRCAPRRPARHRRRAVRRQRRAAGVRAAAAGAASGRSADGAVTLARLAVARFAAGAEPLRDDFAPADQLLTAFPGDRAG